MENVDRSQPPALALHAPPVLCADLPALAGRVGPEPEDFQVDELPAYAASGNGEHHYLQVRKRRLTTPELVRRVARATGVNERDIGYAGLKDKHAVTTQWLSLPGKAQVSSALDLGPDAQVLQLTRHENKLRTGHLLGNRFTITLTGVTEGAAEQAERVAVRLRERGLPNYFGAQRFGRAGRNLAEALGWLERGGRGRGRFEQKLFPSVIQSELFNRYLSARLALGAERLLAGEIVRLAGAGAMFRVDDVEKEQPRLSARDLELTGPMIGPKMRPASEQALELEQRLTRELGLTESLLATLGRLAPGARRDLFAPLSDLTVTSTRESANTSTSETGAGAGANTSTSETGAGAGAGALRLHLAFTLPAGGYATEVIRQLTHAPFIEPERESAARRSADEPGDAAASTDDE